MLKIPIAKIAEEKNQANIASANKILTYRTYLPKVRVKKRHRFQSCGKTSDREKGGC